MHFCLLLVYVTFSTCDTVVVWHCRCFYVVIRLFGTNFGGFQKTQMLSSVGESHSQIVYFRGSHSRPDASFRVAFNDLNVDRTKSLSTTISEVELAYTTQLVQTGNDIPVKLWHMPMPLSVPLVVHFGVRTL